MKARFCVDWDDTLVEDKWPDQGDWLPGAVEALHELSRHGDIIIYSCRVSRWQFPSQREAIHDKPRHPDEVSLELERMYGMLAKEGLGHVEIWMRDYKPAATVYIDNRAVHFNGDWSDTLDRVYDLISFAAVHKARTHEVRASTVEAAIDGEIEEADKEAFISIHDPENRLGLITTARHPSSQAFTDWNKAIQELHDRKQLDYGTDSDPFANVREGAKELGLPGWVGCVIRMNDKMRRLNKAARQVIEGGEVDLANEGVLDSFSDMAVYSGIAHVLFEEEA